MSDTAKAIQVLILNTVAFFFCFACWMLNGVLITFLVEHEVFRWTETQIGWLIGIPVLSGSLIRLPIGIWTDKYGGRPVYFCLMLVSAIPLYLLSYCSTYLEFLLASLGFGLAGGSFAVGIAYSSVWFSKDRQGTALGVFGAGNAGSALTSLLAPTMLTWLTNNAANIEGWRMLPRIYAAGLVAMAVVFWLLTIPKKVEQDRIMTLTDRLDPLRHLRVWRFGLYYFLVFGGFVALSQWLIPYYVNAYTMSVTTAGLMASIFSWPSGVIRALGGWMSDHFGARRVMYWVLGSSVASCLLLIVPRMEVELPGKGIMAARGGKVLSVSPGEIAVDGRVYRLQASNPGWRDVASDGVQVFPTKVFSQSPTVKEGDQVKRRQLIATGVTHIHFQANVWIFTALVFILGIMMGIGKAAVYRHIPDYFPKAVGVVGGVVGVIGGLGGFVCPIIFGWLLEKTGIWTTSWMFLTVVSVACLVWMHIVVQRLMKQQAPQLVRQMESQQSVRQ